MLSDSMKSFLRFVIYFFVGLLLSAILGAFSAGEDGALVMLTIFCIAFGYLIPSFIAFARKAPDKFAITALNTFLGWSVIGWVIALIWAFKNFDYVPPDLKIKQNN